MAAPRPAGHRGWLSHAAGALGVSVLGVALAGSLTLTTSAQPVTPGGGLPTTGVTSPTPAAPAAAVVPGRRGVPTSDVDPTIPGPFAAADGPTSTVPLQEALVAARAAQRAEELAKAADAASRAARAASEQARQRQLDAAGRATQVKGEQLAREAVARAAAARAAAVKARIEAEARQAAATAAAASATAPSTSPTTTTTTTAAPAPAVPVPPAPPVAPPAGSGAAGVAPVPGAVVGASFGEVGLWSRYHTGIDFRAGHGVPIRAVRAGVVLYAGNSGNWSGNHVAVRHADGMTTMSSHMSAMAVSAGQTVQAGQVIGYVGSTGRSFGPHLHFELYPAGVRYGDVYRAVNPQPWLRSAGVVTR